MVGDQRLGMWRMLLSIAWLCPAKDVLVGAIGTALAVGATVIDQIACLLSRAAAACETIATHVTTLIGAIFRSLGRTAQAGVSITAAFLRWCLDLLSTSVHAVALRALSLVG
jgi:triacylglycerol lipase